MAVYMKGRVDKINFKMSTVNCELSFQFEDL